MDFSAIDSAAQPGGNPETNCPATLTTANGNQNLREDSQSELKNGPPEATTSTSLAGPSHLAACLRASFSLDILRTLEDAKRKSLIPSLKDLSPEGKLVLGLAGVILLLSIAVLIRWTVIGEEAVGLKPLGSTQTITGPSGAERAPQEPAQGIPTGVPNWTTSRKFFEASGPTVPGISNHSSSELPAPAGGLLPAPNLPQGEATSAPRDKESAALGVPEPSDAKVAALPASAQPIGAGGHNSSLATGSGLRPSQPPAESRGSTEPSLAEEVPPNPFDQLRNSMNVPEANVPRLEGLTSRHEVVHPAGVSPVWNEPTFVSPGVPAFSPIPGSEVSRAGGTNPASAEGIPETGANVPPPLSRTGPPPQNPPSEAGGGVGTAGFPKPGELSALVQESGVRNENSAQAREPQAGKAEPTPTSEDLPPGSSSNKDNSTAAPSMKPETTGEKALTTQTWMTAPAGEKRLTSDLAADSHPANTTHSTPGSPTVDQSVRITAKVEEPLSGEVPHPPFAGRPEHATVEAPASPTVFTARGGESIFDVARIYLGNPARWIEIVELNRKDFPNIESLESLPPGKVLRLPANATRTMERPEEAPTF